MSRAKCPKCSARTRKERAGSAAGGAVPPPPRVAEAAVAAAEFDEEDVLAGMEVRPRLKRRSVGAGGKQALGGRPQGPDTDPQSQAPILLSASKLRSHFNLPLNDAAKKLGVCATAIKKVCRKMGIKQWPHRKLKVLSSHRLSSNDRLSSNEVNLKYSAGLI